MNRNDMLGALCDGKCISDGYRVFKFINTDEFPWIGFWHIDKWHQAADFWAIIMKYDLFKWEIVSNPAEEAKNKWAALKQWTGEQYDEYDVFRPADYQQGMVDILERVLSKMEQLEGSHDQG